MNGTRSCGGSGREAASSGGVRAVTQPMFVRSAIAVRDFG
jgi:hypothetical protein